MNADRARRRTPTLLRRSSLVLALLVHTCLVSAQQRLVFDHLTVKEGLSQGSVTCIFQDRQGFMWFGTQDGLNRFDGYKFTAFKHEPADSTTLNDSFILTIAEDSLGTLWVATLNSPDKLNRYHPATESFSHHPRDSVDLWQARVGSVYSTYVEPSGVRWSGSVGGGVTRMDPATGITQEFKHHPTDSSSLADNKVYSVYGDRSGTIWIGTRDGLDRFDPRKGSFIHHRHDPADPASISDNWVWPILEDRTGVLWVGTVRGGLNRMDRQTGKFTAYRHNPNDSRSLSDDRLFSLYQDRSGLMWVGTGDHGIERFHPELAAFSSLTHDPANPRGLMHNNITGMCVDHAGIVWIGTEGGLERFDRSTGAFTHFTHNPRDPRSLGDNSLMCLSEDRSGNLWIGFFGNGLDQFDRSRRTFTHFRHSPANPRSLSDNRVYAVAEDPEGDIWVGTYGGGLNRLNPTTQTFSVYTHQDSVPGSLAAEGVWALLVDREGVLWVGTYGGGLDRLDRKTGTFTHHRHEEGRPGSLSDDNILCLHEDRRGYLWVGTFSGLNRFDRTTGSFRPYREKDGLPNDFVYGILEDDHGNLWLSTNKGIAQFDPEREVFRVYDHRDGLSADEFNQNAYCRDPRTGEMYFGGANGITMFHPDSVRRNPYVPPVVFCGFIRYNTDEREGEPIEEPGITVVPSITLSYKDNVAVIEFAALNYYNTFKNRYAYQLEGYSDSWIQLGSERRATFTNLDGGEYTLRVRGSNNDGVWNEGGGSLRIIVTPPWWKTTWAYGAYGLIVVGFLATVRRFEINRREQKAKVRESELRAKAVEAEKRALEAENERKTKELEDARHLQLSMLPNEVPSVPGYEIAVFMKTATEVGGDYYDFLTGEDGTLHVALGDATGHGMQAGTIVTLMKGLFLSDASRFDIQTFFSHCSRAIKEIRLGRLFMAFTLVRLRGSSVCLSTAGMPPVYLRRNDGTLEEILLKGMPLGAMKNFSYQLHQTDLEPGDTLLLLTDGLPEQKNSRGEMFDYARIQQTITNGQHLGPDALISALAREGEQWMEGSFQEDDITLLAIRRKDTNGA